jgi:ferredoxin-nitrate reductase
MKTNIFKTICPYCGVGCGVLIKKYNNSISVEGDPNYPVNKGKLCSKGRNLHYVFNDRSDRLLYPEMRWSKNLPRERVSWETALLRIKSVIKTFINKFGPDSIAFYISGQLLTEEYYIINKIAKGFIGTANIDTNSRLCMSSTVVAFKKTFGSDAVPISYDDIEESDVILIAGANPAFNHPILFQRIISHKEKNPDVKIIVVDPIKTDTAQFADLHLQIKPGTDVSLFLAIGKGLIENGYIDEHFINNYTTNFNNYLESIKDVDFDQVSFICDVSKDDIFKAIHWIGKSKGFLTFWAMGLNQSVNGVEKNLSLIYLNLITGKIGKPGSGTFSLTGQPNAMGGREVGGFSTSLVCHREITNPKHREEISRFWKTDKIPTKVGLTAVEMFENLLEDKLKAIWIVCTNPSVSMPNQNLVREALKKARFVIVQDISYNSETIDFADIVLPAAGWLEKEGTMTNSERRIAYLPKIFEPPGEALPDSEIFIKFAKMMGFSGFDYHSSEDIFNEYIKLTKNQDIDITGLSYKRLKEKSFQWPVLFQTHQGTKRLFTDFKFYTNDQKAHFSIIKDINRSNQGYILLNGRIRDQWHTMTKTGKVNKLLEHIDKPILEISPNDAKRENLNNGDIVEIESSFGKTRYIIKISEKLKPGTVYVPMHWGKRFFSEEVKVNNLTSNLVDPHSKQPDFKYTNVRLKKYKNTLNHIIIIGSGVSARKFIETYRTRNTYTKITVITKEEIPFYNRVLLPDYIAKEKDFNSLITLTEDDIQKLNINIIKNKIVQDIFPENKYILLNDYTKLYYDICIFATGSLPKQNPDNKHYINLLYLRNKEDADKIHYFCKKKCIIVGGGLMGIELANALKKLNIEVTLIHRTSYLMNKQLDKVASQILLNKLLEEGINVILNQSIVDYRVKSNKIYAIETSSGKILDCDAIIFTIGTETDLSLAKKCQLMCNDGIIVNSYLQTNIPNIYAMGEIAEFNGIRYCTTHAAEEQAFILAEYLNGNPYSIYKGSIHLNILKTDFLPIASIGTHKYIKNILEPENKNQEEILYLDSSKNIYKKCIIENGKIISSILVGNINQLPLLKEYIIKQIEIDDKREEFLINFQDHEPCKGELVCSCFRVGKENITEYIDKLKTNNLSEIFNSITNDLKVGTGCGSCKIEVQKIIEKQTKTAKFNIKEVV